MRSSLLSCSAAQGVCSVNINVNCGQPRLNSQPTPIMFPRHTEGPGASEAATPLSVLQRTLHQTALPPSTVKSSAEKKPSASLETIRLSGLLNVCVCAAVCAHMLVCVYVCSNLTTVCVCVCS